MSGHRRIDLERYLKARRKQLLAYSRYRLTGDRSEIPALTSTVNCRSCRACCVDFADTPVLPFESGDGLDIEVRDGKRLLRKKANGECVHLLEGGCSVYEHRPVTCRVFDCRDFAVEKLSNPDLPQLNKAIAQWSVSAESPARNTPRRAR